MPSLVNILWEQNVPQEFKNQLFDTLEAGGGPGNGTRLAMKVLDMMKDEFLVFKIPELAPEVVQVKNNKLWLDGAPANKHCDLEPEHWLEIFIPREFEAIKQAIVKYVRNKEIYVALRQIKADEDYHREQVLQEMDRIRFEFNLSMGNSPDQMDQVVRELAERRITERMNNGD